MATPNIDKDAPPPDDMVAEMAATLKSMGVDTGDTPTSAEKPAETDAPAPEPEAVEDEEVDPKVEPEAPAEGETETDEDPEADPEADPKVEPKVTDKPAETAPKVEPKAEPAAPKAGETDRDHDFNVPLNPNVAPRTKQVIEDFKKKGIEARNERDAIKKQLEETKAKLKEGGMDELTKKELEELRREVRSVNIEKDPGLRMRYDDRIKANEARVLKAFEDKFESTPELLEGIKKKGVTLNTMAKYVKQLEEAGDVEAADEMREMLRENSKLTREKQAEIATIQKDYDAYQSKAKAEDERQFKEATERFRGALVEDLNGIGTKYPEFKRPPLPADGDSEATKKAKLDAVAVYDRDFATVVEKIKACGNDPVLQFRTAAQGIVYRDHILPSLTAKIADLTAQLEAAKGSLGKIKKAGSMVKTVSTPKPADARTNREESSGNEDGVDAIIAAAKSLGIKTD